MTFCGTACAQSTSDAMHTQSIGSLPLVAVCMPCQMSLQFTDTFAGKLEHCICAGKELLAGQTEAATQTTLTKWLNSMAPATSSTSIDRTKRRHFRSLLTSFLADARGLLRVQ